MASDTAKLRWRCRRGMRELDAVLQGFLSTGYPSLSAEDKARFAALLELPDPDLHAYLLRRDEPHDPELTRIIDRIRSHTDP